MALNEPPPFAPDMEYIEPLPTPIRIPIIKFRTSSTFPTIVTTPLATYESSPLRKRGMGLALETWSLILDFLAHDPLALLACALTCWYLHHPAQHRLRILFSPYISAYHDLDILVEELRESPARARCVFALRIEPEDDMTSIPVFSVIPFRLPRILVGVKTLHIGHEEVDSIGGIQCRSQRISGRVMQRHQKQDFRLEKLELATERRPEDQDAKVWFLGTFVSWFIQRRGIEVHELAVFDQIPHGHRLLQRLEGHLQKLTIFPESISPDLTHIRFAALSELEMMSNRATNIPWLQAIISSTLSIESYPRMIIQIHPSKNDFHSPGWKVLDVTIFAYQFLAHRKASKSQSVISGLRRPPVNFSWKLNDPINNSTVPRHLHIRSPPVLADRK
ncbi:hypothetical protein NLI96_g3826 [Meripilus lineatus]|uniref:Uncharacterized protein n=1 Tax=Meripilus lineatus TaxID=2056292 RepID=A0AAD5V628_9APHY|nr:hypothetical protein NLI96_g3826 [Physisporinus lineatus]